MHLLFAAMCSIQIELKVPQTPNPILNLAEVRLFNRAGTQFPNNQLIATMSSTEGAISAVQYCFDGNLGLPICHSGVTRWDPDPKLVVMYPCSEELSKVEVVNRQDCCRDRINNFQMRFLDAAGAVMRQTFQFTGAESVYTVIPQGERAGWYSAGKALPAKAEQSSHPSNTGTHMLMGWLFQPVESRGTQRSDVCDQQPVD